MVDVKIEHVKQEEPKSTNGEVRRRVRPPDPNQENNGTAFPNRRRTGIRISGSYADLNILLEQGEPRKRNYGAVRFCFEAIAAVLILKC